MHDPMTVAFDVKSPFREKPSAMWPKGYRNTIATIWHVDPERDGTDDSCGWFKRARHGDPEVRVKIERAFDGEWDGEYTGWFAPNGMPVQSVQATTLSMFRRACYIHFGDSWDRTEKFMRRHRWNTADLRAACLAGAEALALVETLAHQEICAIPDCDCAFAEAMRSPRAATGTTR